jgi:hypothetical protein
MKQKKCKECGSMFTPKITTTQQVCSWQCAILYTEAQKEKKWRKEKARRKEELKTAGDVAKEAQVAFNKYIRERDRYKGCITCKKPLEHKYDAGHYYSVGSSPELRFDEDNVHGQCVGCNQHLHGNLIEYTFALPERIGQERFEALKQRRNIPAKYSKPELKAIKEKYKIKAKALIDARKSKED